MGPDTEAGRGVWVVNVAPPTGCHGGVSAATLPPQGLDQAPPADVPEEATRSKQQRKQSQSAKLQRDRAPGTQAGHAEHQGQDAEGHREQTGQLSPLPSDGEMAHSQQEITHEEHGKCDDRSPGSPHHAVPRHEHRVRPDIDSTGRQHDAQDRLGLVLVEEAHDH